MPPAHHVEAGSFGPDGKKTQIVLGSADFNEVVRKAKKEGERRRG